MTKIIIIEMLFKKLYTTGQCIWTLTNIIYMIMKQLSFN